MASSIYFFCGPEDYRELIQFVASIGLFVFPVCPVDIDPATGEHWAKDNPQEAPLGFLSFLPIDQLHPYGSPVGMKIDDTVDPMILFIFPYYQPPYLVAGSFQLSTDKFSAQTQPYFRKLANWIRKHYRKRPEIKGFYFGPQADNLVDEEGAQAVGFIPGTLEIKTIET